MKFWNDRLLDYSRSNFQNLHLYLESRSELFIGNTETCSEEAAQYSHFSREDEKEYIEIESSAALRDLKIELEHLNMTDLLVSPEEPSLSAEERVTLTKQAASDTVYKILDTRKDGERKGGDRPLYWCRICENRSFGNRSHLSDHYSLN